jgi:2-(1,2-epoxy-1,2-dihydrophenyl)acetyl-CoA isomerase
VPALLKQINARSTSRLRFARMRAPMIAAVHATAAGAGFSLAMAADFVIAARSAKFVMAYTGIGFAPDGGSTWVLPRLIGPRRASELMITNRVLPAEEALGWGLVSRVVEDERVREEARALARTLAAGPTQAYGAVKRLLLLLRAGPRGADGMGVARHRRRRAARRQRGDRGVLVKRAPLRGR